MQKKGLFIPGLFTTPGSQKFAAMKDALSPYELEIVDFSNLYNCEFKYDQFLALLKETMNSYKPDYVVTYSLGFQLYQNLVAEDQQQEVANAAFIVPVGDYSHSKNGQDILNGRVQASEIYKPINELKVANKISPGFFNDIAVDGCKHRKTQFTQQVMSISAWQDEDVDPEVFNEMKYKNVSRRIALEDSHRMTNTMGSVCELVRSFILSGN